MNMISLTEARAHFSELVNRASFGKERISLGRQGKALVAIISMEDLHLLEKLEDERNIVEADEAMKEAQKKGSTPLKQIMKEHNQ